MASPFHSTKLLWEIRHWTLRWLGEKTARGVVDSERLLRSEKKTGEGRRELLFWGDGGEVEGFFIVLEWMVFFC